MKILHILPRVPPAVCGIGDYSWALARELRSEHDMHSSFLAAGTSWKQPSRETEFPVTRLAVLDADTLVGWLKSRAGEFQAVVLHMSPYGYQKRAVPLWLAGAWQRLAVMPARPRLLTMFHELYASGSPRSSAFWLQPLQRWALRRVTRASDGLRTNREPYAAWLRRVAGPAAWDVVCLPVFSNFGEPEHLPPHSGREPAMVMFAAGIHSGESLLTVVGKAAAHCTAFQLQKLHLIGCREALPESLFGVEIVRHGFMTAEEISTLLSTCRMAYTAYSPEHFGKSTLMAAFAAHGLVVITQGQTAELPDGLHDGIHVLHEAGCKEPRNIDSEAISLAIRQWYDAHSLKMNGRSYAAQIQRLVSASRESR